MYNFNLHVHVQYSYLNINWLEYILKEQLEGRLGELIYTLNLQLRKDGENWRKNSVYIYTHMHTYMLPLENSVRQSWRRYFFVWLFILMVKMYTINSHHSPYVLWNKKTRLGLLHFYDIINMHTTLHSISPLFCCWNLHWYTSHLILDLSLPLDPN